MLGITAPASIALLPLRSVITWVGTDAGGGLGTLNVSKHADLVIRTPWSSSPDAATKPGQMLAQEEIIALKPLISGLSHHRRPMMMNHQPLIPDAFKEICRQYLCLLRFVCLMGGDVLHADDPG